MNDEQIKHMVGRFLGWNLPDSFRPDGGVSFARYGNEGTDNQFTRRPSGTNLLDASQADAMVRHMLDGLSSEASGMSVCLVIAPSDEGDEYGVFSTPNAGTEWANERPESCVIAYPMVVDAPEYGNTPDGSAN